MSNTGKGKVFDAVRSAQEENIISACAESGYYHGSRPSLGPRIEALIKARGKVWSSYGLTVLDEGLDVVLRQAPMPDYES